jgi:peptidoglycan/LPS O-acetylase OafA/YrhL
MPDSTTPSFQAKQAKKAKQRIEYIDFARGFAMLAIVLFHYLQPYAVEGPLSKAILVGGSGVHLFFVLSGFGLGLSSQNIGAINFYKKRFSRILVPYYLVVLAIFGLNQVWQIYQGDGVYALAGHLFLYKMFDEKIMGSFGYHFWFISTIIQFYLVFPFIIWFKQRLNSKVFLGISLLLSIAYWVLIGVLGLADQRIFNSSFLQYLWEFNLGIVLADAYRRRDFRFWQQKPLVLIAAAAVGIGLMAGLALKGGDIGKTFNDIPASVGFISLSALVYWLCDRHLQSFKRAFMSVGSLSYELYLIHMIVFLVIGLGFKTLFQSEGSIGSALFLILPITLFFSHWLMRLNSEIFKKLTVWLKI